ncbi:MAG: ApaG domain, partial [Dokdonella sp.]
MSSKKPYDISISVDTRFLDDQSAPHENRYAFAYRITIANHG